MKKMILAIACLGLGLAACGSDSDPPGELDPEMTEMAPDVIIAEPVAPGPDIVCDPATDICDVDTVPDPVPDDPVLEPGEPGKGKGPNKDASADSGKTNKGKKPDS